MKLVRSTAFVLFMFASLVATVQTASAQYVGVNCATFMGDQGAAQIYFEKHPDATFLDANGDGQACADSADGDFSPWPSEGGPSAGSFPVDCATFNYQALAQAYFDANGQPSSLDNDGDGQACTETGDGYVTGGPTAGPEITCGSFNNDQAAAQAYFEANGQPAFLDGNGDGQACADPDDGDFSSTGPSAGPEQAAEPETGSDNAQDAATVADDSTSASDTVSGLPVAGSGNGLPTPAGSDIALMLAMSLILGAGARYGNRQPGR